MNNKNRIEGDSTKREIGNDTNDLSKKKVYGETCIPEGTYEIKLTYSPRFKRYLPQLMDVKFFDIIKIHGGNTADSSEG